MEKTFRRVLCIALVMAFFCAAYAAAEGVDENALTEAKMAESGAITSDIVAGIDRSSIVTENGSTFFTSVMSDGSAVRFEGTDISVDTDGITMNPGSTLVSLDAVGKIYLYQIAVKDSAQAPVSEQFLDIGYGYTNAADKISVERMQSLYTDPLYGYPAEIWNGDISLSIALLEPNYVFVQAANGNTAPITISSLMIGYNPQNKYTDIAFLRAAMPVYFENFERFFENLEPAETTNEETDEMLADHIPEEEEQPAVIDPLSAKMEENGAIHSDIVAGIDLSSVTTEGGSTFFRSVLSDGSVVRFEGTGISVSAEGLTMNPGSSVTSLDAVGKIYAFSAEIKDKDAESVRTQLLNIGYGYTFRADKTAVERANEVYTYRLSGLFAPDWQRDTQLSVAYYEPNFVYFEAQDYNTGAFTLTSLLIDYNPEEKVTALTDAVLSSSQYGYYTEGAPYKVAKEEKADASKREYDFYLRMKTEAMDEAGIEDQDLWLAFLPRAFYTTGDLKDAEGNVLSKDTARVHEGYTLDVVIGDYSFALALPMANLHEGAQTFNEARPYSTLKAVGSQHVLAVPVVWADQRELATDAVYALYQKALGALIDGQGQLLGDYSDATDHVFSLTEYFDTASYGQLEIASFMTDWYYTDRIFANDYEYIFPEVEFADEVIAWVKATYPDMDWTQFDQDGDGVIDAIVFFSVGTTQNEGYTPASFGGAVHSTGNNYGKRAGTQQNPQVNCFLTVNHDFLKDGDTHTLIHEFSHNFGLNDYYDGNGYGIDAVGGYDMEGSSVGDWNAYSKLAVGWMNEQVVSNLASGESVELSITSSALAGDVIILPAAGTQYNGPFGEYVMIDLLTPDGVNAYDAAKYGLENTAGVRISHVNASLKSTRESDGVIGYIEDNGNVIGMELYGNSYADDGLGFYNLEVIQAGTKNTFTDLEKLYPYLSAADLFYAGDTFSAEDYSEFFYQGLMDNGMPLGYTVTVLEIAADAEGRPTATIRITAN